MMNVKVCLSEENFVTEVNQWLSQRIATQSGTRLFLPAGNTPRPIYRDWENSHPEFLKSLRLLQIDDVLTGHKQGLFLEFFHKHLPSYKDQLTPIQEASEGADLALLGLGLNGHVAFHEPGLSPDFFSGCLPLSEQTHQTLKLEKDTWGISYGLGAFLRCQGLALIVRGASKQPVLKRLFDQDPHLPASHLLTHKDLTLIVDKEAYDSVGVSA